MPKRSLLVTRQANNVLTRHGFNCEVSARGVFETLWAKHKLCDASRPTEIESSQNSECRQKLEASLAYKDFQDMGSLMPFRPERP